MQIRISPHIKYNKLPSAVAESIKAKLQPEEAQVREALELVEAEKKNTWASRTPPEPCIISSKLSEERYISDMIDVPSHDTGEPGLGGYCTQRGRGGGGVNGKFYIHVSI